MSVFMTLFTSKFSEEKLPKCPSYVGVTNYRIFPPAFLRPSFITRIITIFSCRFQASLLYAKPITEANRQRRLEKK